jgi:glutamine synthetase adenylyltransferase
VLVSETPRALEMLGELAALPANTAQALRDTYLMLRRVETRLQLALGLDTKEVPKDGGALRVLALRLGYVDTAEGDAAHALLTDLDRAALETRERYDNLLR